MIVCSDCNEIIAGEMTAEGTHLGGCPSVMTTSTDLAPFGRRLTVDRKTISLSDRQMDAIQRLAKAIHSLDGEMTSANIRLMWPSDTDELKLSGPVPPVAVLETYLRTTAFLQDMARRGVRLDEMSQQLTTQQLALVQMMRNPEGRKLSVILKRAKVTQYQLDSWMKQPLFNKYVTKMIGDSTNQALLFSEVPLSQKAMDGDMNALKFLWEWQDKYNPAKNESADNAVAFVRIVLRAVQEEIKDPEALIRIQKNIEMQKLAEGV